MQNRYRIGWIIWILAGFSFWLSESQDLLALQQSSSASIQVSCQVDQTKVPLNRFLTLQVTISWVGSSDRYTVIQFDNPALSNFDIVGTATVNRSEIDGNQTRVYKDYTYTLKPRELGMGYIEAVILKAHDNLLNQDENLITQRLPVEVTDRLPEPGEGLPVWYYLVVLLIVGAIALALLFWWWRKKRLKQVVTEEPLPPAETRFLGELRKQISLNQPKLHDDYAILSRLLRQYLTEKYQIRGLEATSDELVRDLSNTDLAENKIASLREILVRSDEIKYSGTEGTMAELTRFYTLIEGILEEALRQEQAPSEDHKEIESKN